MFRHLRRVAADDLKVLSHLRHDPISPANRFNDVGTQNAPHEEGDDDVRRAENGEEQQQCHHGDQDDAVSLNRSTPPDCGRQGGRHLQPKPGVT